MENGSLDIFERENVFDGIYLKLDGLLVRYGRTDITSLNKIHIGYENSFLDFLLFLLSQSPLNKGFWNMKPLSLWFFRSHETLLDLSAYKLRFGIISTLLEEEFLREFLYEHNHSLSYLKNFYELGFYLSRFYLILTAFELVFINMGEEDEDELARAYEKVEIVFHLLKLIERGVVYG